jgi:hypothetical protein
MIAAGHYFVSIGKARNLAPQAGHLLRRRRSGRAILPIHSFQRDLGHSGRSTSRAGVFARFVNSARTPGAHAA